MLASHKKTSIYLDPEIDVTSFDNYYDECQKSIAKLNQTQVQLHYEEEMGVVSDSLGLERFNYAIRTLRRLEKQFRNDPVIQEELQLAESKYKNKLKRDVALFESNSRYESALKEIDEYCALLSCENEIKELKTQIQMAYFDQVYVQLENAIEMGLETEIKRFKLQIDKLKDVNLKKYIEIQNKCTDYERNKHLEEAKVLVNQRNYQGAYDLLKGLENTYGKSDPGITQLKKKVGSHIVRDLVKQEKKNRPFNYSFQLGAELFSNEILLDSIRNFQVTNWNFAYSGGLYKMYNTAKYGDHNLGHKVKYADVIGLKFTYFDYPSTFYTGVGDTSLMVRSNQYAYQLCIDGLSARFLHYSFGVKYQDVNTLSKNWSKPSEYYGSLGLRIGIRKINWITDIGFRTQFEGQANFQVSTGLYYRMDFDRKFGRRDRLACKSKLK
jgi:predicted nucleotidyltransferase